ncbi:helix-turn-helix domain-containing protein [Streptomyces specialis]|uniref:helix-turn-helix domain-containing protein n=1 Tax=Streptomyces specialis TaxID=498367 RepID=UPI000A690B24|nr:hypothetical protein [Streptomyces specialis]
MPGADTVSGKAAGMFRCGVTPYEIGHFLGIDPAEVAVMLTGQGLDPGTGRACLPLRRRMGWRAKVADLLRTGYDNGASLSELARRHGRRPQNVHTLLLEADTTMRPPGRRPVLVIPRNT